MFLLNGIIFGILVLSVTPPFQAPDEHNHFLRAYQVSEGQFISDKRKFSEGEVVSPYEYVNVVARLDKKFASGGSLPLSIAITFETGSKGVEFYHESKYDLEKTFPLLRLPLKEEQRAFFSFANTAIYSPVPYLPQSIGIAIGRKLDLSPIILMYMGRVVNLLMWLILVFYAIKIIPINKRLLYLLALLPMSLFQASSLSADSLTNAAAFLFTAVIIKTAYQDNKLNLSLFLMVMILSLTISMSKMTYLPLLGLIFLIPMKKIENKRAYFALALSVFSISAIANIAWIRTADNLYIHLVKGSSSRNQLQFILDQPMQFLNMLYNSLIARGLITIKQYIGVLGWLDTWFPTWFYVLYVFAIILVVLSDDQSNIKISARERALIFLCLTCSTVLIVTSVYLYWTPVGKDEALIQGRYFIPLGPLFFIMVANRMKCISRPYNTSLIFFVSLFSSCYMVYTLIKRYYL